MEYFLTSPQKSKNKLKPKTSILIESTRYRVYSFIYRNLAAMSYTS